MGNIQRFSSRKEVTEFLSTKGIDTSNWSEEKWLQINKGQAEIHMMDLAEKIYDAVNESTPKQLEAGEWHIPFHKNLDFLEINYLTNFYNKGKEQKKEVTELAIKISTAMAAHTSYTVVGNEPVKSYEQWIELHDRLISYDPKHSSPMEHCAKAMNDEEYEKNVKGTGFYSMRDSEGSIVKFEQEEQGWCRNFKGFIPYRYIIENN